MGCTSSRDLAGFSSAVSEGLSDGGPECAKAPDGTGRTIIEAACSGDVETLEPLVKTFGDNDVLNWTESVSDRRTPLIGACEKGQVDVVRLLLSAPVVDVNKHDRMGDGPLHYACKFGHAAVCQLLLAHPSCLINALNTASISPLIYACTKGHDACVSALLASRCKAGALDVNLADSSMQTPLHYAAQHGHRMCVAALLKHPRIDVNTTNKASLSALMYAVNNSHVKIVRLLLASPSLDPNISAADGTTPLFWGCKLGFTEIVEAILAGKHAVDPERAAFSGGTRPRAGRPRRGTLSLCFLSSSSLLLSAFSAIVAFFFLPFVTL